MQTRSTRSFTNVDSQAAVPQANDLRQRALLDAVAVAYARDAAPTRSTPRAEKLALRPSHAPAPPCPTRCPDDARIIRTLATVNAQVMADNASLQHQVAELRAINAVLRQDLAAARGAVPAQAAPSLPSRSPFGDHNGRPRSASSSGSDTLKRLRCCENLPPDL